MSDEGSTTYKHPGNLGVRLALFWLTSCSDNNSQFYLNRAEEMLKEHGLGMECWSSRTRTDQMNIQFADRLVERDDYDFLFAKSSEILSGASKFNYLPLFFCQFRFTAHGLTVSDTPTKCYIKPIILVDPLFAGSDKVTLIHEIGHAAGLDHDRTSTDPNKRNFMNEADTRTTMFKWQIEKMAKSFFVKQ
jgi:hypothetical protein